MTLSFVISSENLKINLKFTYLIAHFLVFPNFEVLLRNFGKFPTTPREYFIKHDTTDFLTQIYNN